jgi:hypothetical protein
MYEREKSRSVKNPGVRKIKERGSANAKARNIMLKKKRARAKSFSQERESASAKPKKKRVPSSGDQIKKLVREITKRFILGLWTPAYTPGRRSDQSGVLQ